MGLVRRQERSFRGDARDKSAPLRLCRERQIQHNAAGHWLKKKKNTSFYFQSCARLSPFEIVWLLFQHVNLSRLTLIQNRLSEVAACLKKHAVEPLTRQMERTSPSR